MKLYLINEVLYDYTAGMVAIAAENLEQCRDIYEQQFAMSVYSRLHEFDTAIQNGCYKELEVKSDTQPGVVTYVYGGG
jgi:hypothetical protein